MGIKRTKTKRSRIQTKMINKLMLGNKSQMAMPCVIDVSIERIKGAIDGK